MDIDGREVLDESSHLRELRVGKKLVSRVIAPSQDRFEVLIRWSEPVVLKECYYIVNSDKDLVS